MADSKGSDSYASQNGHKANASHPKTNGKVGLSNGKQPGPAPLGKSSKPKKTSKLGSLMALRKASKRPLPTQMGDGNYSTTTPRPGLGQDLSRIGRYGECCSF
jgi:linoleate 10R-lipoxygenase